MILKSKIFSEKKIFFITIIYFLILVLVININQFSIAAYVLNKGPDDDLTFFNKSQNASIYAIKISKYIINSLIIKIGIFFQSWLQTNSMHIYGYIKGLIQYLSILYFSRALIRIYGEKIALFSLIIILFDPYLFSLKITLLRDDLIVSFALVMVGSTLNIITTKGLNFLSLKSIPFYLGSLGLLGTKPALAPLIISSMILYSQFNIRNLNLLKNFTIKRIWLLAPLLIGILFLNLGTYFYQISDYLTPSLKNIFITFKNHFISPLPGNELIRNGLLITDASVVYWWYEIRFFIIIFVVFIMISLLYLNPKLLFKSLNIFGITSLFISFAYSQVQDLEILWGLTAGPRQGYLSYLLLVPGSLYLISLVLKRKL
tara:strand:+ start:8828 stop:9946 length:1119 start_codon:yes stop_codon:yes gene_type:complete